MPIDFPDKLRSTRADGKLVDVVAVDGDFPRQIHFIPSSIYDATTRRIVGNLYQATESFATGDLIFFQVPANLPNITDRVRLRTTLNQLLVDFFVFFPGVTDVSYNEMVPGVMHRGIVIPNNRIILLNATGSASVSRRITREITNAELKALDTGYISLISAPGANEFLQVSQIAIKKEGTDQTSATHPGEQTLILTSTDAVLTDAIIAARDTLDQDDYIFEMGGSNYGSPTQWLINSLFDSIDLYIYVGFRTGIAPIGDAQWFTTIDKGFFVDDDISSDFTRVAGTFTVSGIEYQFYRSPLYASRAAYVGTGGGGAYLAINLGDTANQQGERYNFEILKPVDTSLSVPLSADDGEESISLFKQELGNVLRNSAWEQVIALGAMELLENRPIQLGLTRAYPGSYRTESVADQAIYQGFYDDYIEDVDDVTFTITLLYSVHDIRV